MGQLEFKCTVCHKPIAAGNFLCGQRECYHKWVGMRLYPMRDHSRKITPVGINPVKEELEVVEIELIRHERWNDAEL